MATVRIDGVEFELEHAHEFAERALIYDDANRKPLSPGRSLAVSIELCVRSEGGFDVTLSELESHDAPDAAQTLYDALSS